jgi:hypothetical protein
MPEVSAKETVEVRKGVKQCREEVREELVEIGEENRGGCGRRGGCVSVGEGTGQREDGSFTRG